jgi:hypothetical protein
MTNLDKALLVSEDLTRVFHDIFEVLNASFNVGNIKALLASMNRALAVHGSNVVRGSLNDLFEVVDHLLDDLMEISAIPPVNFPGCIIEPERHTGAVLNMLTTEILLAMSSVEDES